MEPGLNPIGEGILKCLTVIPRGLCFRNLLLAAQDRKTRPRAERPLMKLLSLFTGERREAKPRKRSRDKQERRDSGDLQDKMSRLWQCIRCEL